MIFAMKKFSEHPWILAAVVAVAIVILSQIKGFIDRSCAEETGTLRRMNDPAHWSYWLTLLVPLLWPFRAFAYLYCRPPAT